MPDLPRSAVETDHRLERATDTASEELAKHRWHWTLDESNLKRVSLREYARRVDRGYVSILRMAKGYDKWRDPDIRTTRSLTDCIEAADLGVEREAATQAVADARGTNFANIAANQRDEVTSTLGVARERAERRGTNVQEELVTVARYREQGRRAEQTERQERRRMRTAEFMRVEAALGKAARSLRLALDIGDTHFSDEERELLTVTLGNVRALLGLVEMRIAGAADVDWDDELARLEARLP
jgi:hypothetical protein